MKKDIFILFAVAVVLMCTDSCSQCNRTGQMLQWRERGASQAAEALADTIEKESPATDGQDSDIIDAVAE